MRSGPDVVVLSEEDVVTVLHAAETTNTHTHTHTHGRARYKTTSADRNVIRTSHCLHDISYTHVPLAHCAMFIISLKIFLMASHCQHFYYFSLIRLFALHRAAGDETLTIQQSIGSAQTECTPPYAPAAE